MNSPAEQQQESDVSLSDALAEEFDRMDAEEDSGEEHEEVEVSEEVHEETTETTSEEGEETDEVESEEASEELKEEIEDAAESDYTEPAPERWPDQIKEVYNSLPPQARKAMLEGIYKPMQATYTKSTQEIARMRESLNPMLQSMEQYRNDFERMGVNPAEAFRTQMAWAAHLAKVGPEQGLKDMRDAYGLNTAQTAGQGANEYLTPAERAMKAQLNELSRKVQAGEQHLQSSAQQAEQQRIEAFKAEINSNLQSFVNEKTEDGKPAHPHVEKVASGIAGVIRGGMVRQTDDYGNPISMRDQIAQAYEMACNLDPSIRTPAIDNRQVKRAKAAQTVGVATKEPAGQVSDADELSMEDFISKTYDTLARRAS